MLIKNYKNPLCVIDVKQERKRLKKLGSVKERQQKFPEKLDVNAESQL